MVRLLCLILGLAIGFALGYAAREGPAHGRTSRERAATVRSPGTDRPGPSPGAAAPGRPAAAAARAPSRESPPLEPSAAVPDPDQLEEGWGRIVVDLSGTGLDTDVLVVGRDMFGAREQIDCELDEDGLAVFAVRAGRFLVWWTGDAGERVGARARVAPGRVTFVRAVDGAPLPLPAGLGRIVVHVEAIGGGPQEGATIDIVGEGDLYQEGASRWTGKEGRCQFEVIPGRYQVVLGGRDQWVTVTAGSDSAVRFRHAGEGDLVVRGAPDGVYFHLAREGPDGEEDDAPTFDSDELFVYVPAGRYRLFAQISGNGSEFRDLGVVRIEPRVRTEIDARLPTGSVRVLAIPAGWKRKGAIRIELRATHERMKPGKLSVGAIRVTEGDKEFWERELIALSPGGYVVLVTGKGWVSAERRVTVGHGPVELRVELEPEPK